MRVGQREVVREQPRLRGRRDPRLDKSAGTAPVVASPRHGRPGARAHGPARTKPPRAADGSVPVVSRSSTAAASQHASASRGRPISTSIRPSTTRASQGRTPRRASGSRCSDSTARHGLRQGFLAPAEAKEHLRALGANAPASGVRRRIAHGRGKRPIHPGQRLGVALLQRQDAPDVSRHVARAPVVFAEQRLMRLERGPKRAFGVGVPAQIRLCRAEAVR